MQKRLRANCPMRCLVLIALILFFACGPRPAEIKVATYNIYWLDEGIADARKTRLQQVVRELDADIIGLEAGYQHIFNNGFGYVLNATLTDSTAKYTSGARAGEDLPFPGVSDLSYNLTGFYENQKFEARVAYSFRTDFVSLTSDFAGNQVYADDYGQLDASLSYRLRDQYVLFFSGLNLTGADAKFFSDTGNRPVALSTVGARLEFGVRARF